MGGCASKPNDQEAPNPEALPAENPSSADLSVNPIEGDAPTVEAKAEPTEEKTKVEPLAEASDAVTGDDAKELKPEMPSESGGAKEDVPGAKVAAAPVEEAAAVETFEVAKDGVVATETQESVAAAGRNTG